MTWTTLAFTKLPIKNRNKKNLWFQKSETEALWSSSSCTWPHLKRGKIWWSVTYPGHHGFESSIRESPQSPKWTKKGKKTSKASWSLSLSLSLRGPFRGCCFTLDLSDLSVLEVGSWTFSTFTMLNKCSQVAQRFRPRRISQGRSEGGRMMLNGWMLRFLFWVSWEVLDYRIGICSWLLTLHFFILFAAFLTYKIYFDWTSISIRNEDTSLLRTQLHPHKSHPMSYICGCPTLKPIVGMVVTTSPSFSLYRIVVLPAASVMISSTNQGRWPHDVGWWFLRISSWWLVHQPLLKNMNVGPQNGWKSSPSFRGEKNKY